MTDANAEYLAANQMIDYDYTMYDGWYTADDDEIASYYEANFSEELQNAITANSDDPFSDDYYAAMHSEPQTMFDEADGLLNWRSNLTPVAMNYSSSSWSVRWAWPLPPGPHSSMNKVGSVCSSHSFP
ncbi:MAG: hypothetical protein R2911_34820 [Caldilineaceae bacterium]